MKATFTFLQFVIIILTLIFLLNTIIPSYLSYANYCEIRYPSFLNKMYSPVGSYNLETNNVTIFINETDERYEEVLNHENCHKAQQEEGRIGNCEGFLGKLQAFLNELECKFRGLIKN
jgi:maltodextrin utilization protein YvdJ